MTGPPQESASKRAISIAAFFFGWGALGGLLGGCESAPPYQPHYRPEPQPVAPPAVRAEVRPHEITVEPTRMPVDPPTRQQVELAAKAPALAEVDRRILFAGQPVLTGLPAVRAAARERERQEAIAAIRTDLEGPHSHLWVTRLVELLRATESEQEAPWCAAARVVGGVGRYDLAAHLVMALESPEPTLRRIAAQEALHSLYGRWFSVPSDAAPYLPAVHSSPGTVLLLQGSAVAEEVARERLFESLRHDPLEAEGWFQDPDPLVRAGVARVVSEHLPNAEGDGGDRDRILALVFARIDVELEPRAFHAAVQTVAKSQESSPTDAPELIALREKLTALMRTTSDARTLSVAQAFARMPWNTQGEIDDAHLLTGVALLGEMLERVDQGEGYGGESDPDLVLGVLQSLLVLCDRTRGTGLESQLRQSQARVPVFEILQDVHRDETVRAVAVNALSSFGLPADWPLLVTVLERGDATPALSHALLGALPTILLQFDPEAPGVAALLDEVARLSGASDPDLRRRALSLLADERIATLVAGMDPDFLMERLEHEEVPDLTRTVLGLLRELGRPEMFEAVLSTRRFDEIAAGGPADIAELAATLQVLAAGRADESMRAAERLASVPAPDTAIIRKRNALGIVAALEEEAAARLDAQAHGRICAWAWSLQTDGVPLEGATQEGRTFVQRLVSLHWPASPSGTVVASPEPAFGQPARYHLLAVALGVLVVDRVPGNTQEQAEQAFARALGLAASESAQDFEYQVRRDRARFRAARGEHVKALTDYRVLIEVDYLEIRDLRLTVALLEKIGGPTLPGRRAVAPERFDLLGRIVGRPRWFDELPLVRLQDLSDLAETALLARDPERMRRIAESLDGLPDSPGPTPPAVERPLWQGLTEEADWLEELRRARDRVSLGLGKDAGTTVPASSRD